MTCASAVDIHGDIERTGLIEDERIDLWGNLTVPEEGALELRNVTLVFHDDLTYLCGLRALTNSTLLLTDGDGDPSTRGDRTNISASHGPWFCALWQMRRFEARGADLSNLGRTYYDPVIGGTMSTYINASVIMLSDVHLWDLWEDLVVVGDSLTSTDSEFMAKDMFIDLEVQRFELRGSTFEMSELNLQDGKSGTIFGCNFRGGDINLYHIPSIDIENSIFHIHSLHTYRDLARVTINNTSFIGPSGGGIDLYPPRNNYYEISLQNVSFSKYEYGLLCTADLCLLDGCRFVDCILGLRFWFGILDINNTTMTDCEAAIIATHYYMQSPVVFTITNSTFINCTEGLEFYAYKEHCIVSGCSFINCSKAIILQQIWTFDIISCSFSGSHGSIGISITPVTEDALYVRISNNDFEGFATTIHSVSANMSIENNTFNGMNQTDHIGIYCIRIDTPWHADEHNLLIRNNSIKNYLYGISLESRVVPSPTVLLMQHNTITRCERGVYLMNSSRCTIYHNSFENCTRGILLRHVGNLEISNLSISNSTDGLDVQGSKRLRLDDFHVSNITGSALSESDVDDALWNITGTQVIEGCDLSVVGFIHITGSLKMRGANLQLNGSATTGCGIEVLPGSYFRFTDANISGRLGDPYYIRAHAGGELWMVDVVITHCGVPDAGIEAAGLYIEHGHLRLRRVVTRDCLWGVVLQNCTALLEDSHLEAYENALYAARSTVHCNGSTFKGGIAGLSTYQANVSMSWCDLEGDSFSIHSTGGRLEVNDTDIRSSHLILDLEGTNATFERVNISSQGSLVRLVGSHVGIWTSNLSFELHPGSILNGSILRLFNTPGPPQWFVTGNGSTVEMLWFHEVSAVYRWNRTVALRTCISLLGGQERATVSSFLLGENGSTEKLWLLEWRLTQDGREDFTPYTFRVSNGILHGELTSPGNQSWTGILVLEDVAEPELVILNPVDGAVSNTYDLLFEGTAQDLGSGLEELKYSMDLERWKDLEHIRGYWSVPLQLSDGYHTFTIRGKDIDGNIVTVNTTVLVDTTAPVGGFSRPVNGSVTSFNMVILGGFVMLDNGTAIEGCTIDGVPVYIDPSGNFTFEAFLKTDGPHTFFMEAIDGAGNRGTARITIIRDTTPPVLHLGRVPDVTNQRTLSISVSCADDHGITLLLNGGHAATLENGTFELNISLGTGSNSFLLEGIDALGNRAYIAFDILLDTLINGTITAPIDNAVLDSCRVKVSVLTDPHAFVQIPDHSGWKEAPENGSLDIWLDLEPDVEHLIVVEFRDKAGNELVRAVTVTCHEREDEAVEPWGGTKSLVAFVVALIILLLLLAALRTRAAGKDS